MKKDIAFLFVPFVFLGLAWGFAGSSDTSSYEKEREHYCEMREIHRESQGEYGWPENADSRFTDEDCNR